MDGQCHNINGRTSLLTAITTPLGGMTAIRRSIEHNGFLMGLVLDSLQICQIRRIRFIQLMGQQLSKVMEPNTNLTELQISRIRFFGMVFHVLISVLGFLAQFGAIHRFHRLAQMMSGKAYVISIDVLWISATFSK